MAVKYLGDGKYMALAADTKPTNAATNAEVWVTDTDDIYRYNGTSWVLLVANDKAETLTNKTFETLDNTFKHQGGYDHVVIYDNTLSGVNKYRLRNMKTGAIDATGTSLDAVVGTALTQYDTPAVWETPIPKGGHLYLPAGKHNLSAGFAGWSIPKNTTITMAPSCGIFVPDSYAGYVFGMIAASGAGTYVGSMVEGGYIREFSGAGPAADHLWSAFRLACTTPAGSSSVDYCTIRHVSVAYARDALHLLNNASDGLGWINGNTFQDITISDCENGINFDNNSQPLNPINGMGFVNRNHFLGIHGQAGDTTIYGFKNIIGIMNVFIDSTMWDLHAFANAAIARSSTIVAGARKTMIIGGAMSHYRFKDDVGDTIIIDDNSFRLPGYLARPSLRRWGTWMGTSSTNGSSSGIMAAGVSISGTGTQVLDSTNGSRQRFTSTAADVSPAGLRYAVTFTYRPFNPSMSCKFDLPATTAQRLWIGLTGTNTVPTLDTWTDSKRFFGLALRAADTNFQIASNDGAASTTWTSTGVAVDTSIHTIKLFADEVNTRWGYQLDGAGSPTWLSTNVPGNATSLCWVAMVETSTTAARSLDLFNIEVESDK
jgi:hypothetical protein